MAAIQAARAKRQEQSLAVYIDDLLVHISMFDSVTLMDCKSFLNQQGVATDGPERFGIHQRNLFYLVDMSPEFVSIMSAVIADKRTLINYCHSKRYMWGPSPSVAKLPVAKQLHHEYKSPRWVPISLSVRRLSRVHP